ncbi:probable WRKY transcription factor 56 [Carica papaya]|uniref:probable WRKY transcription factor 56 n=1 Tax=Carica papaya TaxID=3649 RepID=UPI000B8CD6EE|nr:probable WRKY transcription factor 56 [Carica papaya]
MDLDITLPIITQLDDISCLISFHTQDRTVHHEQDLDWVNISAPDQYDDQPPPRLVNNGGDIRNVRGKNKGKNSITRKTTTPRIAFHTRSADDILDDGYRWRKYGQKFVKNSVQPR